jgi:hypothetical protein
MYRLLVIVGRFKVDPSLSAVSRNFDSAPISQQAIFLPFPPLHSFYPLIHLYTTTTMAEKGSRWDTPSAAPSGPTPNATAAAQAAAIAAKIAASLRPGTHGGQLIKSSEDEGFVRDIEINDLRNRYVLTKGPTQKKVRESEHERSEGSRSRSSIRQGTFCRVPSALFSVSFSLTLALDIKTALIHRLKKKQERQ